MGVLARVSQVGDGVLDSPSQCAGLFARNRAIYLTFDAALWPDDRPDVQNDVAPIAAPAPYATNGFLDYIERSEDIASIRVALDTKSLVLTGRTFDLASHARQHLTVRREEIPRLPQGIVKAGWCLASRERIIRGAKDSVRGLVGRAEQHYGRAPVRT